MDGDQIQRYSRQLLMPEIGVQGQLALLNSSVIIVGAGGLGSPAAIYLAAAGIGKLGIVDYDVVELNNLHRQVIHNQQRVGLPKCQSAKVAVEELNSRCECTPYQVALDRSNAFDILGPYDIVLDASDNAATRYLVNDVCVLLGKPLVSGSALRMEGQMTVYNYDNGPCYRCLFPVPPPASTVTNCGDGGVLGVVPGIIGCMQALEAIKIILNGVNGLGKAEIFSQKMLLFDAMACGMKTIRLRSKRPDCVACGTECRLSRNMLIDYEEFCGSKACDKAKQLDLLSPAQRISVQKFKTVLDNAEPHLLLDVRQKIQFDICALPNSVNIPLEELQKRADELKSELNDEKQLYVICRRGNRSQQAVQLLEQFGFTDVKDIIGGITHWHHQIDSEFPLY